MKVVDQLTLSGPELGFLAAMGAIEPLMPLALPALEAEAWEAIGSALVARGVLEARAEEHSVNEAFRPLLGVAFLATRSTRTSHRTVDDDRAATVLSAGEVAVLHEIDGAGLHHLRPFDPAREPTLHLDILELDGLADAATPPEGVTLDDVLAQARAAAVTPGTVVRTAETLVRDDPESPLESRLVLVVSDGVRVWMAASATGEELQAVASTAAEARTRLAAVAGVQL